MIRNQIRIFIVENFLFGKKNGLSDETPFLESGIIDSTGVLELIAYIEETYLLRVEDEEIIPENLNSIDNIADYLSRKLSEMNADNPSS